MATDKRASEAFDLLKQGREREARALLERIVEDDVADAAVLETLGDLREKLGDKQGALDAYAGCVMHLRARGELKRALGVLELMLIVDENCAFARTESASIRREQGDGAGAWREVNAACEIFLRMQKPRLAVALAEDFMEVLPEAGPALDLLGRLSQPCEAPAVVELAVKLGNALRGLGRHDDALALYARALDFDPDARAALHARATSLLATGRAAEARVAVERILQQQPDDLVALTLLERAALALGDQDEARAARARVEGVPAHARKSAEREPAADETNDHLSEDTTQEHAVDDDPTDVER